MLRQEELDRRIAQLEQEADRLGFPTRIGSIKLRQDAHKYVQDWQEYVDDIRIELDGDSTVTPERVERLRLATIKLCDSADGLLDDVMSWEPPPPSITSRARVLANDVELAADQAFDRARRVA